MRGFPYTPNLCKQKISKRVIKSVFLFCIVFNSSKSFSQPLSVKIFPGDYVYIFEESRKDSVFNLLIHNIGIKNTGTSPLQLEKVVIDFFNSGNIFQQNNYTVPDILKSNQQLYELQQNKLLAAYDFMFHTKDLLDTAKLNNSGTLQNQTGLILRQLFFTVNKFPDSIRVTVTSKNVKGQKAARPVVLKAMTYSSQTNFILPVKGNWYAGAGPSAHTHHRWGFMEEFAYDFIQFGANNLTYKDDYTKSANYYCYGQDVLAVSAGDVVSVLEGVDDAEIYPKDLQQEEYMKYIRKRQNDLITKFGVPGLNGNSIVVKLSDKEYAFYAHLQKGSITVKPGDKVVQGQAMGKIGNSGNTTEPHLHFQLNETPDVFNSRSIPTRFSNLDWSESMEPEGSYIKSGDFVRTK